MSSQDTLIFMKNKCERSYNGRDTARNQDIKVSPLTLTHLHWSRWPCSCPFLPICPTAHGSFLSLSEPSNWASPSWEVFCHRQAAEAGASSLILTTSGAPSNLVIYFAANLRSESVAKIHQYLWKINWCVTTAWPLTPRTVVSLASLPGREQGCSDGWGKLDIYEIALGCTSSSCLLIF